MRTIFVSSTFQDMHFERDAIQELVHPKLNRIARRYGSSVSFCDLRWGIDTSELESETGSRKVLDVCLDEIDRCQPPMVVILGDRYGWIPSQELVQDTVRRYKMELDDLEKSVTALEIEYGALGSGEKLKNTLFYFRTVSGSVPPTYLAEDEAHHRRLRKLKDRIQALTGGRVRTYSLTFDGSSVSGIEEFARMLTEDLEQKLRPEWEAYEKLSPFLRECYTHESFLTEKAKMFRARAALEQQLLADIRDGKKCTIIKGEVGSGKSTLLSHLALQLRSEGWEVFPLFCSLTAESNTAFGILKLMVLHLEDRLGCGHFLDDAFLAGQAPTAGPENPLQHQSTPSKDPMERWRMRLSSLCAQCTAAGIRLVFLLDAADQLFDDDAKEDLAFLPDDLSEQVRFVMTCLPEMPVRGIPVVELPPVRDEDKHNVIHGILAAHNRELPNDVIRRMVALPAADNPLYLSFLVQRLMMMNKADFDVIHRLGNDIEAIAEHQLAVIEACPDTLQEMSAELMDTAARRINASMIPRVLNYLALSQHGLRQSDLMGLLGSDLNMLDFTHFISYMSDCFLLRDDGRYDFSHKSIREGLAARCTNARELHDDIRSHLRTLDDEDEISKRELCYHAIMADNKAYFAQYIRFCMKQSDGSYAYHAAMNCYLTALRDGGDWLCDVLNQGEQYPQSHILAKFIALDFYNATPGRLSELNMLLRVQLAAMELCERLYQADPDPKIIEICMFCCRTVSNLYICKGDNLKANQMKLRKVELAVTRQRLQPGPWHLWTAAMACAWAANRDPNNSDSMDLVYSLMTQYLPLQRSVFALREDQERADGEAVISYAIKLLEELTEDYDFGDSKENLAECYQMLADIPYNWPRAMECYEKAILIYREMSAQKGETWYLRKLLDVYSNYIAKSGTVLRNSQIQPLLEKRLEIMEQLLETDRSPDFRKAYARAHVDLAQDLDHYGGDDQQQRAMYHFKRAISIMESVVEERGSLWDVQTLVGFYESIVERPDAGSQEDMEICRKAIQLRERLFDQMGGMSRDRFRLHYLYNIASFFCLNLKDEENQRKYSAMAAELRKDPELRARSDTFAEVLEVLRHMDKQYVNMLPKWLISFLYHACNPDNPFRITKPIAEENLSEDTLALLALIHHTYWQNPDLAFSSHDNMDRLLNFSARS